MLKRLTSLHTLFLLLVVLCVPVARAQDPSLQPKYGNVKKTEAQLAADARFMAVMDEHHRGNRRQAAAEMAMRGWQTLRQGDVTTAMRRFNQAWLLDPANGHALWGMGAIQGNQGKLPESVQLFEEAEPSLRNDIDFAVDFARTRAMAASMAKDSQAMQAALVQFDALHKRAPQHTMNIQNWAIALFETGRYAEAWEKITWAEATPRKAELDPNFIAALQAKMPRP